MPFVQLTTGIARQGCIYEPGDVIELGETEAAAVIAAGQAEPIAEQVRTAVKPAAPRNAMNRRRG